MSFGAAAASEKLANLQVVSKRQPILVRSLNHDREFTRQLVNSSKRVNLVHTPNQVQIEAARARLSETTSRFAHPANQVQRAQPVSDTPPADVGRRRQVVALD